MILPPSATNVEYKVVNETDYLAIGKFGCSKNEIQDMLLFHEYIQTENIDVWNDLVNNEEINKNDSIKSWWQPEEANDIAKYGKESISEKKGLSYKSSLITGSVDDTDLVIVYFMTKFF